MMEGSKIQGRLQSAFNHDLVPKENRDSIRHVIYVVVNQFTRR